MRDLMIYPCNIVCDGDAVITIVSDGDPMIDITEDGECGVYYEASSKQSFDGSYNVTPRFEGQTLNTRDKIMLDDVTVEAISVSSVSNPAGGRTVYIGGNINYG